MIFRCSVCKGQFELEPDRKKAVVFCAHCGAALKTGKPIPVKDTVASAAERALMGDSAAPEPVADTGGSALDQINATRSQQAQGFVEMFDPGAPTDAPAPAGADPLAALTGEATPGGGRRPIRRLKKKQDNTAVILTISIFGIVALFTVVIVAVIMMNQPEPEKPKAKQDNFRPPAFFDNVKDGQTAHGENADKPKSRDDDQ